MKEPTLPSSNAKAFELKKGSHCILPYGFCEYKLEGKAEFIVSYA
ncbi:hypothetical protein [Bacillus xiapuensis]|uniref:Phosphohexomutase n=1 Tax=Bacillus xiapuensis TaxID=2014075 RepID=A0ABU6N5H9_9BACI|nr:hypothetical protein [Bacillus xiapuensis]